MKGRRLLGLVLVLCLGLLLGGTLSSSASPIAERPASPTSVGGRLQASEPIIIDHTCTDLSKIPDFWIQQAKSLLRVSYGHTSHGSQPISGMGVLEANTPSGLYDFNTSGAVTAGVLSIADGVPDGDLGSPNWTAWASKTRTYLNGAGSNRNVVVWSWCGQVSGATSANILTYLNLMNGLEQDYPDVTFVYMTGHLDGGGVEGNLNVRNNQIRQYSRNNNKVLFDFADIESYDPDGDEFLSKYALDSCNYTCGSSTCNWANQWCATHGSDPLCDYCSCAHSEALNCNLKARAFWWMMARIAGWPGPDEDTPHKVPSTPAAYLGDVVTYTIEVRGLAAPPSETIYLTDEVPTGLEYVPDSLDASAGDTDDGDAPTLRWSGALGSAPLVTVTYAVTVTASGPSAAINTATLIVPTSDTQEHTAMVILNPLVMYLPLGVRSQ